MKTREKKRKQEISKSKLKNREKVLTKSGNCGNISEH